MAIHRIKTSKDYFEPVMLGLKTSELRLNDRDYKVGDWLILEEYDSGYSGRELTKKVLHVADVGFIAEGYVLLSII